MACLIYYIYYNNSISYASSDTQLKYWMVSDSHQVSKCVTREKNCTETPVNRIRKIEEEHDIHAWLIPVGAKENMDGIKKMRTTHVSFVNRIFR